MSQAVLEAPGADVPDEGDEAAAKADPEGITELEKFDAERVDLVENPANGFGILMLKQVQDDGETAKADGDADDDADADRDSSDDDNGEDDEDDDAAKAVADATPEQRQAYKTAAAEWRAREPVHKGAGDGTSFLQQRAAWQKWHDEGAEKGLDGSEEGARRFLAAYAPSDEAVKAVADAESAALGDVEKTDYSTEERRQLASEGKALSDGCLSGETLVATPDGPRRIDSLTGKCTVLTDCGWEQAEVRSFGIKSLLAVTLTRGREKRTVYATAGHRWLTEQGEWLLTDSLAPGVRIPHVKVLTEGVQAERLDASYRGVAAEAQQPAYLASDMVMVNLETGPVMASARTGAGNARGVPANRTSAALLRGESIELLVRDAVLSSQGSVTPGHPALVAELDSLGTLLGPVKHAEAAFGTAEFARPADVEVSVRTLNSARTTRDRALVLGGGSVRLPRRTRAAFRLSELKPTAVTAMAPAVHAVRALSWLSAIGARFNRHVLNATRSKTWEVTSVKETPRVEEVFCAVVPDLHRFVLASGILTGNSYPIKNTTDLDNAYKLAASGHGNVAAAKRLIAKRARELGVPNPFDSDKSEKAAPPAKGKKVQCPTCKGDGKIKDGNMTCPDCKGKGKVKPGKVAAKAGAAIKDGLDKAVAAGIITREAADAAMAEIADAAIKATRPLPADVKPAGHHREPDGSSTIERLEPEAGMATDKDPVADKVPASVGKEASYGVQRFHDATCAAYAAKDVLAAYPALDGIADAIDPSWLTKAAVEATEAGKAKKAARLTALAEAAGILKDADPAILADGHAFVHKAFTDMYPSEHCSPSSPPAPGSYQRPYLTSGHAAEHASGKANVPPSSHVPDPGQFHRGYLTAGHAAPSPANQAAGSANYAAAAKTYAEQSLKALHDHIEATYGGVCPMAPSRSVLPPDMGARNVPQPRAAQASGGVNTIKEGNPVTQDDPKAAFFDGVKADSDKAARKAAKAGQRELAAEVAKALAEQGTVADAASIKALVDAQLTPLREKYEQQISELTKQVDELGAQPDPAMAPVRGQIARIPAGTAAPVEKRSLVDEAREREQALLAKEAVRHADYVEYLQKQAGSTSPQVREAAQAELDKIGAAAAVTAPA